MIFVTLGTQDKPFTRLLEAIQKQIDAGVIKDKVIVQAGYTKFESDDMKIYELINMDEFDKLIKECDILITHGGVGNILTGLKYNKKIIAAARLEKYGEHTNDHQLQIVDKFADEGYILKLSDFVVKIPMMNDFNSLNVSTALSAIIFETVRQKIRKTA